MFYLLSFHHSSPVSRSTMCNAYNAVKSYSKISFSWAQPSTANAAEGWLGKRATANLTRMRGKPLTTQWRGLSPLYSALHLSRFHLLELSLCLQKRSATLPVGIICLLSPWLFMSRPTYPLKQMLYLYLRVIQLGGGGVFLYFWCHSL